MLQEALWQKLSLASEQMHKSVVAIWHVQRVLAKKRDPLTHVLFIDDCLTEDSPLPAEQFWYAAVVYLHGVSTTDMGCWTTI